jgi:long-chain acyl-CoA synthetase
LNIMMLLEMAASGFGERPAFVDPAEGSALTYQELFDSAAATASAVKASGAGRLAMLDVNSVAFPVGLFASGWAGIPFVPINYRLTAEEIDALIGRIKPAYLVTEAHRVETFRDDESLETLARHEFLDIARSGGAGPDPWSMDPDDTAVMLFTSGTTGAPKAAVLRQKHLVSYILNTVEFMSADESETALVSVPPYHVAGIAAVLSSVYSGRRVVQLANFSAEEWINLARKEGVTSAFVVPTMLARIVDALEGASTAEMPHLQSLSYGGGRIPLPVIERAMELFPDTDFTDAYGLTETSSTITVLGPEEHRAAFAASDEHARRRMVSAGVAVPGIEIEIRDEAGKPLGRGEHGEVYVRGEQVSGEYEGIGSTMDAEGWFPTHDAGYLDEAGYLFLEGRADDIIVRGGENISPGEIEDVLMEHEAVADAAVVGVPDTQWGESVAAAVVLRHDASVEALQAWVKEHMRSSRVPERIEFWSELPYTETGKLLRRIVREQMA